MMRIRTSTKCLSCAMESMRTQRDVSAVLTAADALVALSIVIHTRLTRDVLLTIALLTRAQPTTANNTHSIRRAWPTPHIHSSAIFFQSMALWVQTLHPVKVLENRLQNLLRLNRERVLDDADTDLAILSSMTVR